MLPVNPFAVDPSFCNLIIVPKPGSGNDSDLGLVSLPTWQIRYPKQTSLEEGPNNLLNTRQKGNFEETSSVEDLISWLDKRSIKEMKAHS